MKAEVIIDWLTFTVKADSPQNVIQEYLGMDPDLFEDTGYGLLGYQKVIRFGNIMVMYEGRENTFFKDMGVCVSMSGQGCREFEALSRLGFANGSRDKQGTASLAFPVLFSKLSGNADCNVTRVDVACDDKGKALDMDCIIWKFQRNEINSRMNRRQIVQSFEGDKVAGATCYLGARSSDFYVRIYDKAAEQGTEGHWVRVELVLKGKNSVAFVNEMASGKAVGQLAAQIINDKFSFIERDDSNITRCSVCDWWLSFVDELTTVTLVSRCVVQHPINEVDDWLSSQIGPSMALIMLTLGFDHLRDIANHSIDRLSPKQEALIKDYNSYLAASKAIEAERGEV